MHRLTTYPLINPVLKSIYSVGGGYLDISKFNILEFKKPFHVHVLSHFRENQITVAAFVGRIWEFNLTEDSIKEGKPKEHNQEEFEIQKTQSINIHGLQKNTDLPPIPFLLSAYDLDYRSGLQCQKDRLGTPYGLDPPNLRWNLQDNFLNYAKNACNQES